MTTTRQQRPTGAANVTQRLNNFAGQFDKRFVTYLSPGASVPSTLREAIHYSALAPGKRVRPYLVMRCCELVGDQEEEAWPVAAAMECVHAFSLIHDDLPAMDNADVRRGRPTNHKVFGEAVGILAGDALIVLAFELITRHVNDGSLCSTMVQELAEGAGWAGMIGGQMADMLGESEPSSVALVQSIHDRKTASLFRTACRLGALVGRASSESVAALGRFGEMLGRAFQIADDLLDVTAAATVLGKTVGKDAQRSKQSLPRCVGIEQSRAAAVEAVTSAVDQLQPFGSKADDLRDLATYVIERDY